MVEERRSSLDIGQCRRRHPFLGFLRLLVITPELSLITPTPIRQPSTGEFISNISTRISSPDDSPRGIDDVWGASRERRLICQIVASARAPSTTLWVRRNSRGRRGIHTYH